MTQNTVLPDRCVESIGTIDAGIEDLNLHSVSAGSFHGISTSNPTKGGHVGGNTTLPITLLGTSKNANVNKNANVKQVRFNIEDEDFNNDVLVLLRQFSSVSQDDDTSVSLILERPLSNTNQPFLSKSNYSLRLTDANSSTGQFSTKPRIWTPREPSHNSPKRKSLKWSKVVKRLNPKNWSTKTRWTAAMALIGLALVITVSVTVPGVGIAVSAVVGVAVSSWTSSATAATIGTVVAYALLGGVGGVAFGYLGHRFGDCREKAELHMLRAERVASQGAPDPALRLHNVSNRQISIEPASRSMPNIKLLEPPSPQPPIVKIIEAEIAAVTDDFDSLARRAGYQPSAFDQNDRRFIAWRLRRTMADSVVKHEVLGIKYDATQACNDVEVAGSSILDSMVSVAQQWSDGNRGEVSKAEIESACALFDKLADGCESPETLASLLVDNAVTMLLSYTQYRSGLGKEARADYGFNLGLSLSEAFREWKHASLNWADVEEMLSPGHPVWALVLNCASLGQQMPARSECKKMFPHLLLYVRCALKTLVGQSDSHKVDKRIDDLLKQEKLSATPEEESFRSSSLLPGHESQKANNKELLWLAAKAVAEGGIRMANDRAIVEHQRTKQYTE